MTLLHLFLFEIPTQFHSSQQNILYQPYQFLTIMKQTSDRIEEFLSEDARLPLIVKAIRKEPDFLNFQIGRS